MARVSLKNPPEVFVSTAAMSAAVSRAVAAGKLRKLGSRLYTTNLAEDAEVHPFTDGNGRVARVMMNAELAAARQVRVIIPIVYRSNYLSTLRALSANAWPVPIIKTLAFAQRYVAAVPWDELRTALAVLTRTNAFVRPEEGDDKGIRLRIPDAADIAAAQSTDGK